MEESISLLGAIKKEFSIENVDVRAYSPLTLAFVGDCIYDLVVRTIVAERGHGMPNTLHKKKSELVKAAAQAAQAEALLAHLTQEELAVYKRGRNAHSHTAAKNASIADYRKATGLEALYGFLYLTERTDRLLELVRLSYQLTDTAV